MKEFMYFVTEVSNKCNMEMVGDVVSCIVVVVGVIALIKIVEFAVDEIKKEIYG